MSVKNRLHLLFLAAPIHFCSKSIPKVELFLMFAHLFSMAMSNLNTFKGLPQATIIIITLCQIFSDVKLDETVEFLLILVAQIVK